MGSWHVCAINEMVFAFSGTGSGVADGDWWRKFLKYADSFLFSSSRLVFLTKQHVPSPPNNIIHNFWLLLLKKTFQNVAERSGLQEFVTVFIIFFPCMDIDTLLWQAEPTRPLHLSKKSLIWFLKLFKKINSFTRLQEKRGCCPLKRILRTWHLEVNWGHW